MPTQSLGTPSISGRNLEELRLSTQFWMQQVFNHLDRMTGFRGTPTFHSDIDARGNSIRSVAAAVDNDQVVIKQQLDERETGITDTIRIEIRQAVADVLRAVAPGAVPPGIITGWSGAEADIPAGYALCDGSSGTPDLRDRFIVGAGSTYSVGDTGGNDSIDLTHTHSTPSGTSGAPSATTTVDNTLAGSTVAVGSATHTHSTPSGTSGNGLGSTDIRPKYYALCFIMKL